MNPALVSPTRDDEQDVLSAALRRMGGPDVELADWSTQPLAKHGKQRVVRYDLHARAAQGGDLVSYQWVGKFYEDDGAARRVAAVLRELAGGDCGARGQLAVPRVLAYDAPRRLLLLTYEAAMLVGKIHVLTFDLARHPEAGAERQVEAVELLRCLANGRDSARSS